MSGSAATEVNATTTAAAAAAEEKKAGTSSDEAGTAPKATTTEGSTTEAKSTSDADTAKATSGAKESIEKASAAEAEKGAAPEEEVVQERETVAVSSEDASTPEAQRQKERLRDAEKTLLIDELFARDEYQRFVRTTEVSTVEGLRWLDVSASPEFFDDPLVAHAPEGQFAYSVMRKLFGSEFPIGMYASVASGAALPATYVDENWACLILRTTKEVLQSEDDTARRPGGYGSKADYDLNNTPMTDGDDGDCVYDEATNDYYPRRAGASQHWAQKLERRLQRRRLARKAAAAGLANSAASVRTSSSVTSAAYLPSTSSSHCSPLTMADLTDRLTIFIGKELHPVERVYDASRPTTTAVAKEALVLSPDVNRVCAAKRSKEKAAVSPTSPSSSTSSEKGSSSSPSPEETATPTHYEVRWRVITVHRSPITFMRDMQSQWNKLTSRGGRPVRTMRTVPADHQGQLDSEEVIKEALRRAARPASMDEEEEEDSTYDDMHNTMVDRVTSWEDLVRLLYHGAARTLQEAAYRNTRRLEVMETAIFDVSDHSAQHLRSMTRLMAELHLLSREATIHNAILRESKVAFQKLKRVLDHPVDLADNRELLYTDSVLSITAHLEEQSESLLFLQFSVAMNQTELHLRTLTIFNTLFIPLDFICTCCGSDIFNTHAFSHSKGAMYAVFGLMATTAVVTLRWIRRNLR